MARSTIPPTSPHFFKPILPDSHQELVIPSSFLIKYLLDDTRDEHCKQAVLKSSSTGKNWLVTMNGRCLEDGWPEFARDHDLHVGDFLVFRHEGNLVFHVMVFDVTACERKYPLSDHHDDQSQDTDQSFKSGPLKDFRQPKDVFKKKPEHPCFWGTVPFFKYPKMCIPSSFARANGLSGRCSKMILINEKGKSWPVKLWYKKCDGRLCISQGWLAFQVANGLKSGDVLIFELIEKGATPIINVHDISRTCLHPYFVETMKPTNINYSYLVIPMKFVRENDLWEKNCEIFLRDQQGRSWPVTLIHKNDDRVHIINDWNKFTVANDIKVGDIFVVELVKEGAKLVMNFFSWKEFFAQSLESKH
ncbi:B3 domain-containing protein REM17-like [Malania oleifera]|uniref:B3 domain-containing protein REM17-like n=1 Tax=Malania oleifera TaxID=397392 RepID=UPI0025AEB106|nr:B3 domain-containing protein REM17-like [Malania oleifera]